MLKLIGFFSILQPFQTTYYITYSYGFSRKQQELAQTVDVIDLVEVRLVFSKMSH